MLLQFITVFTPPRTSSQSEAVTSFHFISIV